MIGKIEARIHYQIKKHSANNNVVEYALVKEWVARIIIKKGGIPREDIPDIIDDMCKMGLLKKRCRLKYEILPNTERKVREPIF